MNQTETPAVGCNEGLGGFTLKEVVDFLNGEEPLEGAWFGEEPLDGRGRFWWRQHLRAALAALAAERVPLTERQIADAVRHLYCDEIAARMALPGEIDAARAIEAAHGIKPLNAQVTGPVEPNRSNDGNQ